MDHDWELMIPILEILEIEVSNVLCNPGTFGNRIFAIFSYPGNTGGGRAAPPVRFSRLGLCSKHCPWNFVTYLIWQHRFCVFLIFLMFCYTGNTGGGRAAPGVRLRGAWIIFGTCFLEFPDILEICCFYILDFFQKRCAPKFHAGCTDGWAEISHMRPIQAKN